MMLADMGASVVKLEPIEGDSFRELPGFYGWNRGKRSIERLEARYPKLILVHLPVHASWLNQVEIYFSIVQRKVLQPNDFTDLTALEERLLAFARHYEQVAQPFQWKFTRDDLDRSYGSYATYDIGKELVVGGGNLTEDGNTNVPTKTAVVLNSNSSLAPTIAPTGSMSVGRRQFNATVLAARPNVPRVVTSHPVRNGEAEARRRPALKQNPAPVARSLVG